MTVTTTTIGRWPVDEPLPAVLHDRDLMRVLGIKHSRFYARKKTGEFEFLQLRPQPKDGGTLYSGHLVTRWTRGELGESRYFQAPRRKAS